MGFAETVLLSMALSIDALSIGASCGFSGIRTPFKAKLTICLVSLAVTATAVFFGGILSNIISELFGKILGAVLLAVLGIYMLVSALLNREPVECDIDRSSSIDYKEACFMGLALSADSFSAGISAGIEGGMSIFVPVLCGVFQMIFLCVGEYAAKHISGYFSKNYFGIISGIILIATAICRILI